MIEFKGVTKTFGKKVALNNISLTIPEGTAFGLLGSNGAGKSTLLRLLTGIYLPDSGTITLDGEDVYDKPAIKRKMFFVGDETVQFYDYTLTRLKNYYRAFYPNFSDELFDKICDRVQLPLKSKLSTFSKGMRRQAIIAIGVSCQTKYLLVDEALDGVDPAMRITVKKILMEAMADRGSTIVMSSHNLHEVSEMCDSAAMMRGGDIIFSRDIDTLREGIHKIQFAYPRNEQAKTEKEIRALLYLNDIEIVNFDLSQSVYRLIVKGERENIKNTIESTSPTVFDMIPLTLEEIFIYETDNYGHIGGGLTLQEPKSSNTDAEPQEQDQSEDGGLLSKWQF